MSTFDYNIVKQQLQEMNSFQAIASILKDITLHDVQCIDIMRVLLEKRALIIYETGTGKTLIAAALMRLLRNADKNAKFVFLCKKDQLIQTPEKLYKMLGFKIVTSTAEERSVQKIIKKPIEDYDLLMITHECLRSPLFTKFLRFNKDSFKCIFIDEAHELNNFRDANTALVLSKLTYGFEYCYSLTATPITTDPKQLSQLLKITDPFTFGDLKSIQNSIKHNPNFLDIYKGKIINRSRKDFGVNSEYRGIVHWVNPTAGQIEKANNSSNMFMVMKGDGAINQVNALIEEIENRGRGLVYINQHAVRDWVIRNLDKKNIKYACINGYTAQDERREIMDQFNNQKSIDVIITSVTTAIDLDCDYVIFYEFTVNTKQMIGRAHRGLTDKVLDIVYIITKDSPEIEYFIKNIYERSEMIRQILYQDNSELEDVSSEIREIYD